MATMAVTIQNNDFFRRMQRMDFPECTHVALNYLVHSITSGSGNFDMTTQGQVEVARDFILFSTHMTSNKTLGSIQELQLLEILHDFFTSLQRTTRLSIFNIIFGGKPDDAKVTLFNKLTSLAISLKSSALLDCAAMWMQTHGFQSRPSMDVVHCVIQDFCDVYAEVSECMMTLPSVDPEFSCNLITVFTHVFYCQDISTMPSSKLVRYVNSWLMDAHLSQALKQSGQSTRQKMPLQGLINWSINGAILIKLKPDKQLSDTTALYSQLHLAILHTLMSCPSNCQLTIAGVGTLVERMIELCQTSDMAESLHNAVEQLAQILQVSLVTRNLRCRKDELVKVLWKLPPNRLLDILMKSGILFENT